MYLIYDLDIFVVDEIRFEDFFKVDICLGMIVEVEVFFEVCNLVFKLRIDFGFGIGIKCSVV